MAKINIKINKEKVNFKALNGHLKSNSGKLPSYSVYKVNNECNDKEYSNDSGPEACFKNTLNSFTSCKKRNKEN
jgi:hypothetical protein